jgi:hypothetical protein
MERPLEGYPFQTPHKKRFLQSYTVERELCIAADPGREYVIEVSVCSTAPMADRFRCLFRHRLASS